MLNQFRTSFVLFSFAILVFMAAVVGWFARDSVVPPPTALPPITMTYRTEIEADFFMKKYPSAAYLTVLKFDFQKNTRTPIYRSFNRPEIKEYIMTHLKGGDGSLPMFLHDDVTNNENMITILEGESVCEPFDKAGLSRVWPELSKKFTISCRVPVPPIPGVARGYIVVHFDKELRPFDQDTVKRDLIELAKKIQQANGG